LETIRSGSGDVASAKSNVERFLVAAKTRGVDGSAVVSELGGTKPPAPSPPVPPTPESPKADAKPAEFKSPGEAQTHFADSFKTALSRPAGMSDADYLAVASHVTGQLAHMDKFKAVRDTLKKRSAERPQTLRVGADLEKNTSGKYRYGSGIELAPGTIDPDAVPATGRHVVGGDFGSSFRHEFGHDVFSTTFSNAKQREWVRLAGKYVGTSTVSRYGGTNESELFAESFGAYTSPNYKPGTLPADLEKWLEKNVRG
jgi:hypothetical protein